MMPASDKRFMRIWDLANVLVCGKRESGEAWGRHEREAVIRFAARCARERRVDVGAAVAGALRDPLKKVSVRMQSRADANNKPAGEK